MKPHAIIKLLLLMLFALSNYACAKSTDRTIFGNAGTSLNAESFGKFSRPWAMTFLPSGDLLVTEKEGKLRWVNLASGSNDPKVVAVNGLPNIAVGGQGGLGDVVLHPQFTSNQWVYFSYAEQDQSGNRGAVVARAKLRLPSASPRLENVEIIWRQLPKTSGSGHYSYRIAFGPDGYLFITSGDKQLQTPAQDWNQNLGKVIRLNDDGSVPSDNPFQNKGELAKTFWSVGHRNLLGIAFDKQGKLWTHEMGPRDGDEFNLTVAGKNYGWPVVSWGDNYSGSVIPNHDTRPEFNAPALYWVPSFTPSGMIIYKGSMFPKWQGDAIIGGLRTQSILQIRMSSQNPQGTAKEVERFNMGNRIREVEQGPDGALWALEDGGSGRLLRLTPNK